MFIVLPSRKKLGSFAFFIILIFLSGHIYAEPDKASDTAIALISIADTAHAIDSAKHSPTADSIYSNIPSLDRVVVRASRKGRLMETAQSISVIKPEEWVGTQNGIADVVAAQAGVQTRKYGGIGSFQTVSVRGVSGSEVLVLLDGLPLNSAMGGAVNLGRINPALIQSIELYKGITPAQFGGNSIGGVINLTTASSSKGESGSAASSFGSYGYQSHSLTLSHTRVDSFSLFGSISYQRSDNDFPYLDRNNTAYNTSDDTLRKLENSTFSLSEIRFQPTFQIGKGLSLITSLSASLLRQDIPGPEGNIYHTATYSDDKYSLDLRFANDSSVKTYSFSPQIRYQYNTDRTFATKLDPGFTAVLTQPYDFSEYTFSDNQFRLLVPVFWQVTPFFSFDPTISFCLEDGAPGTDQRGLRQTDWHSREATIIAAADLKLSSPIAGLGLGLSGTTVLSQCDGGTDGPNDETILPSDTISILGGITGTFWYKPYTEILIYTNAGRFSNQPSLRERYGARGPVLPNPELKPEYGISADIGFKWNPGFSYLELCGFFTQTENTIFLEKSGNLAKSLNDDKARIYGLECTGSTELWKLIQLETRTTLQHSYNYSYRHPGRVLPNEPECTVFGGITLSPLSQFSISYHAELKTTYYLDAANTDGMRLPTDKSEDLSIMHGGKISWIIKGIAEFSLSANNITFEVPKLPDLSWILVPTNEWCISAKYLW